MSKSSFVSLLFLLVMGYLRLDLIIADLYILACSFVFYFMYSVIKCCVSSLLALWFGCKYCMRFSSSKLSWNSGCVGLV